MGESCTIRVNGVEHSAAMGMTVAAALGNYGEHSTRQSVSGQPRGPLCGMGVCFECRGTVNGTNHERTCMIRCEPGSDVQTGPAGDSQRSSGGANVPQDVSCDVLVVGGGPAGLAAAATAAEMGRRIILLDDNPGLGGQIWRNHGSGPSQRLRMRVKQAGVHILCGTAVVERLDAQRVLATGGNGAFIITHRSVVLATGATELFLPFPGWTLPNVMGVGGLQAMAKGGLNIRGKRIVIAGSGPLLLAVGAYMKRQDADVRIIAEQASFASVRNLAGHLVSRPRKLLQGAGLKAVLHEVEQRYGWWPVAAEGSDRVRSVTLTNGRGRERFECDYLAVGFGLVPSARVATVLGCTTTRGAIAVDQSQRTDVSNVYAAGECTGIGGVDKALIEGQIAGFMCADRESHALSLFRRRDRELLFAKALGNAFALREELKDAVKADTIVCRCEDVAYGRIASCESWRDAKLQTRCGMGPCQGRICGPIVRWLTGWPVEDARPPVFNVPVRILSAMPGNAAPGSTMEQVR